MTRIGTPTNRGLLDSRYLKLTGSLSEVTNHSHTVLTDIGTNTHAQIDTHLAGTLAVHAATTSLQLAGVISDETGSGALMFGTSPTITTSLIMSDGATIGQAAGPLVAFDDTNNYLEITGCNVGIGTTGPSNLLSVVSATGGIVDISRNDTSITAADLIGQLDFRTNDTQTTTNKVAGEIKVSAANTIATDINPGIMDFLVTGTGVAGALIECMSFQATTVAQIGFFGVTPAVQPSHIADPTGGVVVDIEARAAIVSINALLATLGLSASS